VYIVNLKLNNFKNIKVEAEECPWFPIKISELDKCSNKILLYSASELDVDHPVSLCLNL
jgi:tryptophan 5-monooxygenase